MKYIIISTTSESLPREIVKGHVRPDALAEAKRIHGELNGLT